MRKRLSIVGALAVGLSASAWLVWIAIQPRPANEPPGNVNGQPAHEAARQPDDLSAEEEATLRAIVSEHLIATAYWAPGGADPYETFDRYRVLVVPRGVKEIFKLKPIGTLRVLKRIIEVAPSADAHAAIAHAHAAVGYANDDPVPLIHAHSYAHYPTADEFEDVNPVISKTYRQFAIEEIDALITEVAKKKTVVNKKIVNAIGMEFVLIPPGTFAMGSSKNEKERSMDEVQHTVTLTKGFYLGTNLVTQEQWQAVMGTNPSTFKHAKNLPVEKVSWDDCQKFCKKLSEKDKRPYRLPTEAEWEYACRAGTKSPFSCGETISTNQANYDGNIPYAGGEKGLFREKTTPIGTFAPNPWGLYDMHGNAWQWCQDRKGELTKDDATDPSGPKTGELRIVRGGCWNSTADACRSASRAWYAPRYASWQVGCRICFVAE